MSPSGTEKTKTPDWAISAFREYLDVFTRLREVLHLSRAGIYELSSTPRLLEVTSRVAGTSGTEEYKRGLEEAKQKAEQAKREIDDDFQVLHALGIVGLWSYLESIVRDTVVAWLRNTPELFNVDEIKNLRIRRLGEYEQLSPDEKLYYVVKRLEEKADGIRNGIDHFEGLLKPLGLDGVAPKRLKDDIYEMGQVRNAIVHNCSRADRQLIEACPWLGLAAGDTIPCNLDMYTRHHQAASHYVILLICRTGEHFGDDLSEDFNRTMQFYEGDSSG